MLQVETGQDGRAKSKEKVPDGTVVTWGHDACICCRTHGKGSERK